VRLTEIETSTGGARAAIRLHPADNVGIAGMALSPGNGIQGAGAAVTLRSWVPAGHKVALEDIPAGAPVRRYGDVIGVARTAIRAGEHVHTHNLEHRDTAPLYEFPDSEVTPQQAQSRVPQFEGYVRPDGRVGTRNYIAVAAASNCAAEVVRHIAEQFEGADLPPNVDGVAGFPHGEGCGHAIGPDTLQLRRTISGLLDHPNVGGAVIVGLGCEVNLVSEYLPPGVRETEQLTGLTIQECGGSIRTLEAAAAAVRRHIERAAAMRRAPAPVSRLVLGLNCGGSDSFSGISANPALGICSDLLVQCGGTAVLAETPEIFGAEHLLVRRARNRGVAEALLATIESYREYLRRFGASFDDNPAPGNKEGGLTNIVEKSLGAVAKGGSTPLMQVLDYAARIRTPGLVFMNTPGYDPVSLTGLASGGANLIAFTTGRGSAIGFPTVPVLKIAANTHVFHAMRDNMDINAGRILDGESTLEDSGREIFERLLRVASGERTAAERLEHREFVPWRIGPVL